MVYAHNYFNGWKEMTDWLTGDGSIGDCCSCIAFYAFFTTSVNRIYEVRSAGTTSNL
jgi:hypothetical protein